MQAASLGDRDHASLNLRMAVGAEQRALARLRTRLLEGPRDPSVTQGEPLLSRYEVMELKRSDAPAIAAHDALAAGRFDKHALDLATSSRNRLSATLRAPVSPCAPEFERARSVLWAPKYDL